MKWEKTGRTVNAEGTTVIYTAKEDPRIQIESRKRKIPHANRSGYWEHTSYFVTFKGVDVKERWSLADAKEYAEEVHKLGTP